MVNILGAWLKLLRTRFARVWLSTSLLDTPLLRPMCVAFKLASISTQLAQLALAPFSEYHLPMPMHQNVRHPPVRTIDQKSHRSCEWLINSFLLLLKFEITNINFQILWILHKHTRDLHNPSMYACFLFCGLSG